MPYFINFNFNYNINKELYFLNNYIPLMDKLKHPNLSPDIESAPHYNTTASGLKFLKIASITGSKIYL